MYKDEQETIIRFDETQTPAEVYTASPRVHKLLTRYGLLPHRTDRDRQGKEAVCLKPANRCY